MNKPPQQLITRYIALFTIVLLISSCSPEKFAGEKPNIYFDLREYVEVEAKRLNTDNKMVGKTVWMNGQKETKQEQLNWEEELQALAEANINKSAYVEKYKVDTLIDDSGAVIITYIALEDDLRTRKLKTKYVAKQIKEISAVLRSNNIVYNSKQLVTYEPGKRFSLKGYQSVKFSEPDSFRVEILLQQPVY